jgi:hypothetical protein
MTQSLIDELQMDAANASISVANLLRKALIVAAKLGIPEVPEWIDKELSGYYGNDQIPSYRNVRCRARAKLFNSLIDIEFPDNDMEAKVSERRIDSSVAEIETLLARNGALSIAYAAEAQKLLRALFKQPHAQFICVVERASLVPILDQIRNEILRWAIALDKAGVRGEGLSFSQAEKEKANSVVVQNAGAITIGNIGNVSNHSNVSSRHDPRGGAIAVEDLRSLLSEIRSHTPGLRLPDKQAADLDAALAELDDAANSKTIVRTNVRPALNRILAVVGEAGQTILAAGIKAFTEQWIKAHGLGP